MNCPLSESETFEITGSVQEAECPVIAHVPHSSTHIPPDVRNAFVLDDELLRKEVVRLTDWHVEKLFDRVIELGGVMFVNRMSRLVVDPERFRDDSREEMASRGMGAVCSAFSMNRRPASIICLGMYTGSSASTRFKNNLFTRSATRYSAWSLGAPRPL